MARNLSISEARSRLPELAHRLARSPGSVEYIEHRDLDETLALTTKSHILYLEAVVKELRSRVARPFALAGSIVAEASDARIEATLEAARKEQEALAGGKLEGLAG